MFLSTNFVTKFSVFVTKFSVFSPDLVEFEQNLVTKKAKSGYSFSLPSAALRTGGGQFGVFSVKNEIWKVRRN